MNLEERYNAASENTYVGRVKKLQAAEAGPGPGVNFVDGDPRSVWSPDSTAAPDQIQTEFTRNASGDFRYGGGGKVPGSPDDTYALSRWLTRGLEKAFGADGYFTNNRFTTVNDVRNASTVVHKYAPISGKRFDESAILSELSKGKISGSPTGPSPAGLGG
jgi:hypothetical protein